MTDQPPETSGTDFSYDNRTGRGPGRFVRALGRVLPGIAKVQGQVEPYADAWRERNLRALQVQGRRWFVLGDSMSQSVGASAHDSGWVDEVAARLPATDRPAIVNLSATGARVADVLDQQLPALLQLGPREGDVITVLIGSNDLFAGRRHRRALPGDFAAMVDALPRGSVVATLPQPRAAARRANGALEAAVRAGRLRLVDMRTEGPASWRGLVAEDRFHPNDAGYRALADAFAPVVLRAYAGPG